VAGAGTAPALRTTSQARIGPQPGTHGGATSAVCGRRLHVAGIRVPAHSRRGGSSSATPRPRDGCRARRRRGLIRAGSTSRRPASRFRDARCARRCTRAARSPRAGTDGLLSTTKAETGVNESARLTAVLPFFLSSRCRTGGKAGPRPQAPRRDARACGCGHVLPIDGSQRIDRAAGPAHGSSSALPGDRSSIPAPDARPVEHVHNRSGRRGTTRSRIYAEGVGVPVSFPKRGTGKPNSGGEGHGFGHPRRHRGKGATSTHDRYGQPRFEAATFLHDNGASTPAVAGHAILSPPAIERGTR
jgi:hypothetical protein